jgi:hypothetical protein
MKKKGFAMLYTVLMISIMLALVLGITNLVFKERQLTQTLKESLSARSSADSGMECMLFNDKMPTRFDPAVSPALFGFTCGRDTGGAPVPYTASFNGNPAGMYWYTVSTTLSSNDPCFTATLTRDVIVLPPITKIEVSGYNMCDRNAPKRVERGIVAEY